MLKKIKLYLATFILFLIAPFLSFASEGMAYKVTADDVISIEVNHEPDLSRVLRVDKRGMVSLPFIGDVSVENKSATEIEELVVAAYLDGNILKQPFVTVTIQKYAEKYFYIFGQVSKPGMKSFPAGRNYLDIIEVIAYSGDFLSMAQKSEIRIVRKKDDGGEFIVKMDVRDIFNAQKARSDKEMKRFRIYPDDLIYVPERFI